jgi:hypothetical protein
MVLEIINPLENPGWDQSLLASGDQAVFHTSAWARVLSESYGYKPAYFIARQRGNLIFVMPLMVIKSAITGTRGVTLPYTDFCDPFCPKGGFDDESIGHIIEYGRSSRWSYLDLRFGRCRIPKTDPRVDYLTHDVDLGLSESDLFMGFRGSNRRNISTALRRNIRIEFSRSQDALREFCRLNGGTRKRHGLPPQPAFFFKNILAHVLTPNLGVIGSARLAGKTVAAAVFLHFGHKALFKYGASDAAYLSYRPNNLLLWEAIKRYKDAGCTNLNLGRTNIENPGLLQFKRTWGGVESALAYVRYDYSKRAFIDVPKRWERPNRMIAAAPAWASRILSRIFYRHMG